MRYRLSSLLIVTVAVAIAAGYGARASRYIQSLVAKGDTAQAAVVVFAAVLALIPLAFILAVRLGQWAIVKSRPRPEPVPPSQPSSEDPVSAFDYSQECDRD